MSAGTAQGSLNRPLRGDVLGIVAGGGAVPRYLLEVCDTKGIPAFVVGFEGQTDPETLEGRAHILSRPGAAGGIVKALREQGAQDLVLIGSLRRPHLSEMRPDLFTAGFFARLGLQALGDNGLLSAVRKELEKEGFTLHGVQAFAPELLMPSGPVGRHKPGRKAQIDIKRGIEVVQALGALDVGQAAIIRDGVVLGVEGAEGTNALLRRCAEYRRGGKGGVLVKLCKPQQDRDLDLPTIGPETVALCAELGMNGIAVQAKAALLPGREKIAHIADRAGLFVVGIDIPGTSHV